MIEVGVVMAPQGRFTIEMDDRWGPCHVGTVVRTPVDPETVKVADRLIAALPALTFLTCDDARRQVEAACQSLDLRIEWWPKGT